MDPRLTASEFMEALALYREARGESKAAKAAMLAVIRNRAAQSPKFGWPRTTTGVITQKYQFSSFNPNDPNSTLWPDVNSPGQWQAWLDCCDVVQTPMLADPTNGANAYHAIPVEGYIYKDAHGEEKKLMPPNWATADAFVMQIGKNKFYKL